MNSRPPRLNNPVMDDLHRQLASIKQDINSLEDSIKNLFTDITQEKSRTSNSSQINDLFIEKKKIEDEIETLNNQKISLENEIQDISQSMDSVKTELSSSKPKFRDADSVNLEIQKIEHKIITDRLSVKQENAFRAQINELKTQLNSFSGLKIKENDLSDKRNRLNELIADKKDVNSQIYNLISELKELRKTIAELKEVSKKDTPEVVNLKNELNKLQKTKSDKLEARKVVSQKIKDLHEQQKLYLKTYQDALSHQQNIKDQKSKLYKLKADLEKLSESVESNDLPVFDAIISSLAKIKDAQKFPGELVAKLTEYKLRIPRSNDELVALRNYLEKKKVQLKENASLKYRDIQTKIKEKRDEISSQERFLEDLIKMDIKLPDFNEFGQRSDIKSEGN